MQSRWVNKTLVG